MSTLSRWLYLLATRVKALNTLVTCLIHIPILDCIFYISIQGPISATEVSLPSGKPGCQTKNYNFQEKASKPSWKAMTQDGITFKVIFSHDKAMYGRYHGLERLLPQTEKYVRFYRGRWFSGESADRIDIKSACNWGGSFHVEGDDRRICILGMILR